MESLLVVPPKGGLLEASRGSSEYPGKPGPPRMRTDQSCHWGLSISPHHQKSVAVTEVGSEAPVDTWLYQVGSTVMSMSTVHQPSSVGVGSDADGELKAVAHSPSPRRARRRFDVRHCPASRIGVDLARGKGGKGGKGGRQKELLQKNPHSKEARA